MDLPVAKLHRFTHKKSYFHFRFSHTHYQVGFIVWIVCHIELHDIMVQVFVCVWVLATQCSCGQ